MMGLLFSVEFGPEYRWREDAKVNADAWTHWPITHPDAADYVEIELAQIETNGQSIGRPLVSREALPG
jgi:accessory colonization factor AcfC